MQQSASLPLEQEDENNNNEFLELINPFSFIFWKALDDCLSVRWEKRHASVLVLRSFIRNKNIGLI